MRLRRALLVTTAVSTVLFGSAGMAYAQSFDWSGFYVGVGVAGAGGFDGGELSWFDPDDEIWDDVLGDATTSDDEPFVGGGDAPLTDFPGAVSGFGLTGSAGYNVQMDNFLFGIEASISSGPFKSEATYVQSGTVTVTTTDTTTLYATNTTDHVSTESIYTPTTIVNTSSVTHTSTIISEPNTTITTYTDTYVTFMTSTTQGTTQTVYFPTSTVNTVVTNTSALSTTALHTSTETNYTSTATAVTSYATSGEWTETITGRAQIDWLATIKGRIGITADRTLFFATGGLAIAGVSQETTAVLSVEQNSGDGPLETVWHGSNDETRFGFVVGGGIEQALDDHWIVSGEFEYFNLGTAEYDVETTDLPGDNHGHQTQVLDGGSVKFGVKYKF